MPGTDEHFGRRDADGSPDIIGSVQGAAGTGRR